MIGHQQKGKKQAIAVKSSGNDEIGSGKKVKAISEGGMTYNPELDKFSGDQFIPEKHKEVEARFANRLLPPFK